MVEPKITPWRSPKRVDQARSLRKEKSERIEASLVAAIANGARAQAPLLVKVAKVEGVNTQDVHDALYGLKAEGCVRYERGATPPGWYLTNEMARCLLTVKP